MGKERGREGERDLHGAMAVPSMVEMAMVKGWR